MQLAIRVSPLSARHIWWCLPLMLGAAFVRPDGMLQAAVSPTAVAEAAKADDVAEVRNLIRDHADVNATANDGSTALLWAAYHSDAELAKALLAGGAQVDVANHYGLTPLLQASRNGDIATMKVLLDGGADATRWHPEGETPLMAAARSGKLEAVKLLLAHGAFVNAADPFEQETALMWASAEGHLDIVKALLAAGADPNMKAALTSLNERDHSDHPSGGFTALMFAVREGHDDVAKALVAGKADLKLTDGDGATATVIAIVNDRFDLAKELLDMGADPNDGSLYWAVDMHDATTDMRAHDGSRLQPNHPNQLTAMALTKALLDLGADVNKPFQGALHSTTLCCGVAVNASPFYRAAVAADVDMLKLLLAHGAKVDWTPVAFKPKPGEKLARGMNRDVGKTPLMAAMAGGTGAAFAAGPGFSRLVAPPYREAGPREPLEALKVLLAAGANPNAKAPDGTTPLHQAVQLEQVEMIHALVTAGAKTDALDKKNETPLMAAEKLKNLSPAELAQSLGMDADAWRRPRNSRAETIAGLRADMHLGADDPVPVPPAALEAQKKEKAAKDKAAAAKGDKAAKADAKETAEVVKPAAEKAEVAAVAQE